MCVIHAWKRKFIKIISHKTVERNIYLKRQAWHMDLTGRKDTLSLIDGDEMSVIVVEEVSKISAIYNIKTNNAHEINKVIERWNKDPLSYPRVWYKDMPNFTFFLRADNLELTFNAVKEYVKSLGIVPQFTAVEQSSTNGLAERTIRNIDEMSHTMRLARSLPKDF